MYDGKTFLVTGASSGIGAAVVRHLLNRSARVIGVSRSISSSQFPHGKERLEAVLLDLSDLGSMVSRFSGVLKKESHLEGAILCHGYGAFGSLEQFSNQRIEHLINTNLTSHIMISRLITPMMKAAGCGNLIFMGSESALKGGKKGAVYCAAKFGLRGLAQALREECSSAGVRVSIVNPGMVDTPFFDELDFGPDQSSDNHIRADDIAKSILSIIDMPVGTVVDEINLSPLKKVIRNKTRKP